MSRVILSESLANKKESARADIVQTARTRPRHETTAGLKKLAADIRRLSAGRAQTALEQLLREGRDEL